MKAVLTIEKVRQFCNALAEKGESVTTRAIVDEFGGSMTKALAFKRQWEEEQTQAARSGCDEVSDSLQQAILLEIGKAVDAECAALREELAQSKARELEGEKIIKNLEEALETRDKENERINKTLQDEINDASRKQAVATERDLGLQEKVSKLILEKSTLTEEIERLNGEKMTLTMEKIEQVHLVMSTETLMKQQSQLLNTQIERLSEEEQIVKEQVQTLYAEIESLKSDLATVRQDKAVSTEREMQITKQLEQITLSNTRLESKLREEIESAATERERAANLKIELKAKNTELDKLREDME